jgi:Peptidase family M28/PDZ domain
MNFKRFSSLSAALLLVTVGVIAQQRVSPRNDPSVAKLQQHVFYLASDALDGRRTGTAGANDAAHYIAGEFSRIGLRPGIQRGSAPRKLSEAMSRYLQAFPYVAGVNLGKGNSMSLSSGAAPRQLRVGDDWMPLGFSASARLESTSVAFVGYGITAAELNHDDYANKKAAGRIAIALAGTPDGDNPHGQFARYEGARWKAIAARNGGARALLIVTQEASLRDDRMSQLSYDNSAGDAGLPVAVISQQALGLSKTSIAQLLEVDNIDWDRESVTISIDLVRREVPAYNVVGVLEGSDPKLKTQAIVIGAHYDHLGRGGEGSLAPRSGEIHHGADDNASGVAGMLELARVFAAGRPRPKRTIIFMAFSGEEEGLLGSSYYVNHPLAPLTNTVAMINMDMIGRMKDRKLIIGGIGTAKEWRDIVGSENTIPGTTMGAAAGPSNGSSGAPLVVSANGRTNGSMDSKRFDLTLNEDGYGPSDHSSFYSKQIPVLFFWTGTHNDYHKPSDTADKINYVDEARILSLVARIVRDVDRSNDRLTYTVAKSDAPAGRSTGFRVYLGTIPNYADTNEGLLLDGVRDDSPAAKGGLKAGDRVVKIGDREVKNVYDYTYALGEMKAGQEYVFEVIRGTERLTLKVTPEGRK